MEYEAEPAFLDAIEERGTLSGEKLMRLAGLAESPDSFLRARTAALLALCREEAPETLLPEAVPGR